MSLVCDRFTREGACLVAVRSGQRGALVVVAVHAHVAVALRVHAHAALAANEDRIGGGRGACRANEEEKKFPVRESKKEEKKMSLKKS